MYAKLKQKLRSRILAVLDRAVLDIWMKRRHVDFERVAYVQAAAESVQFFQEFMPMTPNLETGSALFEYVLDCVTADGLWLEFGVRGGGDIRRIAGRAPGDVFGFDSFEGLPEDWTHFQRKGRYSMDGQIPDNMPPNVQLIKGWFSDTLPTFLAQHRGPIAFLHIDSDLYSSAKTVLNQLQGRITDGTVILLMIF